MQGSHYNYLIVGAGISGLRAAQILAQTQQNFVVLQADGRIGGRICTQTIGQALAEDKTDSQFQWLNQDIKSLPIQCGATWLSQDQHIMHKVVKNFGLTMFPQYYAGSNILALKAGSRSTYQHLSSLGQYYKLHLPTIQKLLRSLKILEVQFKLLNTSKKNGTITATENKKLNLLYEKYDSMNAYQFILQEVKDQFLAKHLSKEAETLNCANGQDYSVLTLITEDGFSNLEFYLGTQEHNIDGFRLKEGMSTVVKKMKENIQFLTKKNRKIQVQNIQQIIRLNTPVVEIRNDSYPVQVCTQKGEKFTCAKVIVAVPIATMKKIKFSSISKGKQLFLQNQLMGAIARQVMIFKEPFWRKLNKSGYASFSHEFPMNELVDLTPCDSQCGILGFVFAADGWAKWKDQIAQKCQQFKGSELKKREYDMLKKESVKILADLFLDGNVKHEYLKQMVTFTRSLTTKPYIAAAYQAVPAIGVFKQVNALGQDIEEARFSDLKNVIILGSDFSTEFRGYMEGAVRIAEEKIKRELKLEGLRSSRL